jgi:hypothetical protein
VTDHDSGAPGGAVPKLTLGQRLLTLLPDLQRQPARRPPMSPSPSPRAPNATESATSAEVDDEPVDHDETTDDGGTNGASSGVGGRIRDSLLRPAPASARRRPTEDLDAMSREEIAHRIKKLDDRERFLAITAAPLGVLVGILLTAVAIHLNPAVGKPKHVADSTLYIEGGARILLSGLVVLVAMSRRRSLVGFALLFLGTSMGAPLFALPFWALGGYFIWRVFKYQKALTARGGAPGRARGSGRVPPDPRAAGRAGAAAARARAQAPRRRGKKDPVPAGPTPSKRYTPPRPARPRPPAPPS